MRRDRAIFATALAVAALIAAAASASSGPTRTVLGFGGLPNGFGERGGRVAWIDAAWFVRVQGITGGWLQLVRYTNADHELRASLVWQRRLAMNRTRLLWWSSSSSQMFVDVDRVLAVRVDGQGKQTLVKVSHGEGAGGGYVLGLAGDSSGFAYGQADVQPTTPDIAAFHVVGGGVFVFSGVTAKRLPGVPPAIVLAAGSGRVAVEPVSTEPRTNGTPRGAGSVEVRDAASGSVLLTVASPGVRAAAITGSTLAVLSGSTITRYSLRLGRAVGTTPVPASTAPDLEAAGNLLVARTANAILTLDLDHGGLRAIPVPAPWHPTGVAIDGTTITWVESRRTGVGEPSRTNIASRVRTRKASGP